MPLMHIWLTLILILVDFIPFFSILLKKKEKRQRALHNWRKWIIDEAQKQLMQDFLIVLDLYFPWYYSRSCECLLDHFVKITSAVQVGDWVPFLSSTTHMLIMSQRTQIGNCHHLKPHYFILNHHVHDDFYRPVINHWDTLQCNCKQMGRSCIWIGSTAGHAWMRDRCSRLHSVLVLLASTIILASRVDIQGRPCVFWGPGQNQNWRPPNSQ